VVAFPDKYLGHASTKKMARVDLCATRLKWNHGACIMNFLLVR
jgi:hypothetical protein